jgi:hypothetical protein
VLRLLWATEDDDALELVEPTEANIFVFEVAGTANADLLLETAETEDFLVLELVTTPGDDEDLLDEVVDIIEPVELLTIVVYGGKVTLPLKSYTSNRLDPPQNSE